MRRPSPETIAVLKHLVLEGDAHGYKLARTLSLSQGTLSRMLNRLESRGYVGFRLDLTGSGPARKVYSVTAQGIAYLQGQLKAVRTT